MKRKRCIALILALAAFFTLSSGNAWLAPAAEAQNEDSSEMTWSASFTDVVLPEGFSIVPYKCGYENAWAALEYSIGDFASLEEAKTYFTATYLQKPELFSNILFLINTPICIMLIM